MREHEIARASIQCVSRVKRLWRKTLDAAFPLRSSVAFRSRRYEDGCQVVEAAVQRRTCYPSVRTSATERCVAAVVYIGSGLRACSANRYAAYQSAQAASG